MSVYVRTSCSISDIPVPSSPVSKSVGGGMAGDGAAEFI